MKRRMPFHLAVAVGHARSGEPDHQIDARKRLLSCKLDLVVWFRNKMRQMERVLQTLSALLNDKSMDRNARQRNRNDIHDCRCEVWWV